MSSITSLAGLFDALLLPALRDRDVLRFSGTSKAAWHRIRYSDGCGWTLPHIAHLPLKLTIADAVDFVGKLNLTALRSICFDCVGSDAGKPWFPDDKTVHPPNRSLGRVLLALTKRVLAMRTEASAATPLLCKLECVACDYLDFEDCEELGCEVEDLLTTLLMEAPNFRSFDLGEMALDVKRLCPSVESVDVPGLASLKFTGCLQDAIFPCSKQDASHAGRLLRCMTSLRHLDLFNLDDLEFPAGTVFTSVVFGAFVHGFCTQAAKKHSSIEDLTLRSLHLIDSGADLARLLSNMPRLRTLTFGTELFDGMDDFPFVLDAQTVSDLALHGTEALSHLLEFRCRGISAEGLNPAPVLHSASSLRILDFSNSLFGDDEMIALAYALRQSMPALKAVDMHECMLESSNGAVALGTFLSQCGHVECLRLQGIRFKVDEYNAFSANLSTLAASCLRLLEIGGIARQPLSSDESVAVISAILKRCRFITKLNIHHCTLDAQAWWKLCRVTRHCVRRLKTLSMTSCFGLHTFAAGKNLAMFLKIRAGHLTELLFRGSFESHVSANTLHGIACFLRQSKLNNKGLCLLRRIALPWTLRPTRNRFTSFQRCRATFKMRPLCSNSLLRHMIRTCCPRFTRLKADVCAWSRPFGSLQQT
eukprot:TRINITY_DN47461_c0_g1_i1.p1 TRINITY_DN47461_c0_g1~~TRINITY_DN47461_c0_g1_i1.p1  ORF type:complete len:648 (+),score=49.95 TRINITY_DN47461_c0_g1_i1:70-2013(+)